MMALAVSLKAHALCLITLPVHKKKRTICKCLKKAIAATLQISNEKHTCCYRFFPYILLMKSVQSNLYFTRQPQHIIIILREKALEDMVGKRAIAGFQDYLLFLQ